MVPFPKLLYGVCLASRSPHLARSLHLLLYSRLFRNPYLFLPPPLSRHSPAARAALSRHSSLSLGIGFLHQVPPQARGLTPKSTGWPITSRTWVGLTFFWLFHWLPDSAWADEM